MFYKVLTNAFGSDPRINPHETPWFDIPTSKSFINRNFLPLRLYSKYPEAGVLKCPVKNVFLKNSLVAKKRLRHRYFSVHFPKSFKNIFFTKILWATASGYMCAYQGVRNISFSENFANVLIWMIPSNYKYLNTNQYILIFSKYLKFLMIIN